MLKVFYKKIKRKYFYSDKKIGELQNSYFFAWTLRLAVGFSLGAMTSLFLFQGIEYDKQSIMAITNEQGNKNYYLTSLSPVSAINDKEVFWSFSGAINDMIQGEVGTIRPLHHTGFPKPPVLGDQRIAIILAYPQDITKPETTSQSIYDLVFTDINNYYKENSYNKISLSGDIYGWYGLAINSQSCVYGNDNIFQEAVKMADPDIYFPDYDGIVVIGPFGCRSCAGGKSNKTTDDGVVNSFYVVISSMNDVNFGVISHELGHGFGNFHAGLLGCSSDYCDPFDLMGEYTGKIIDAYTNKHTGHFNAPHKEHVGWLDSPNIQTASVSGAYSLEPLETITSGVKTVKIQRSSRSFLYIEYRRPVGYDAMFKDLYGASIFDGILMHVTGGSFGFGFTNPDQVDTFLVDPTPNEDKSFVVRAGENYIDPATKTKIAVTSISDNSIDVNIELGTQDNIGPTISVVEPEENETVLGEIEVVIDASDSAGIDHAVAILNNKAIGDSRTPLSFVYNTIDPSAKWTDGIYSLNGYAVDGAYNTSYLSAVRNIKVDNSSVLAEIKSPQSGSYVRDIATISPSSLSKTISKIEFFKDFEKAPFASAVSAPFETSWDTKGIVDGSYRLKAKIYYSDGNFSTSKVNITVDNTVPSEPLNFKITSANAVKEINIDWDDSTDANGIKEYKIYRDEIEIAAISESRYLDSNLVPSTAYVYQISAVDKAGNESIRSRKISVTTLPSSNSTDSSIEQSRESKIDSFLVAPALGSGSQLRLFNANGALIGQFFAYEKSFRGGISFVAEDLDSDGIREIITAPGSGREPEIKIFNSKGKLLYKFLAYSKNFQGGVNVAAGDLNGDGNKEIITSPRSGALQIRIFGFKGGKWTQIIKAFYAYSKSQSQFANITVADIDGDGKDEIIAAPGPGTAPVLKIFGLRNNEIKQITPQIYAYDKNTRNGVNLSAGDIDGDGNDEIIVSSSTGNFDIKVFKKASNGKLVVIKKGFFPFGRKTDQGINTAAADINGDGKDEIIASTAGVGQPVVHIFSSDKFKKLKEFKAYPYKSVSGLRVGRW